VVHTADFPCVKRSPDTVDYKRPMELHRVRFEMPSDILRQRVVGSSACRGGLFLLHLTWELDSMRLGAFQRLC